MTINLTSEWPSSFIDWAATIGLGVIGGIVLSAILFVAIWLES